MYLKFYSFSAAKAYCEENNAKIVAWPYSVKDEAVWIVFKVKQI